MALSPAGRYRINVTGARGGITPELQAYADRAEAAADSVEGVAAQIVPDATVTMGENSATGTNYIVKEPNGFRLDQQGVKFTFVVPETNLSDTNAYITIMRGDVVVQASVIRMVIGQKLRERFRAEFTNNKTNANFNLDHQSPDGLTFFDLEDRAVPAYEALSKVVGVQFAVPIKRNPNELFIADAPVADSVVFEAIITATNTDVVFVTNGNGQRLGVVGSDEPVGVIAEGTIASFQYSGGFNNFVYLSSRPIPTLTGESEPELWAGFDDVIATHYGGVAQGSNGKPVFTPIVKRIVGRGSSVVTDPGAGRDGAAPAGQAPVAVLAAALSGAHGPGNTFYADNWSHGGHVQSQAEGQWEEALAADSATPVWALFDGFGMNDMQMSAYNSGQISPVYFGVSDYYEAEVKRRLDQGVKYYIACTTPHDNTEKQSNTFGGNNMQWPYAKSAPVAGDQLVPPFSTDPSLNKSVTAAKDWSGSGIFRPGNARGGHVNELIRNTLRRLHNSPKYRGRVFLLDAEWAWFRYGVEQHDLTELYGPNEIVHPQLLGHQVSYQRCIREFVAASRRGYGDQWCFRGEVGA